ncbi:diguanylate cyclase [Ruminococcaceae bacterium OttesenSCG-928-I18]|nr:diguanylate cyclase [Ruminococcaceae bacterium OttesenSCG-928-I18]
MEQRDFGNLFDKLQTPVVVCENREGLPVVYCNEPAALWFMPTYSVDILYREATYGNLKEFVKFRTEEGFDAVRRMLNHSGYVSNYQVDVVSQDYTILPVDILGCAINVQEENDHFLLYLIKRSEEEEISQADTSDQFLNLLNASLLAGDADDALQLVINLAGAYMDVSRVYIFEEIDPNTTRNTYEWCAEGIQPAIQDLQNLDKKDYPYDHIIESGMFIVEDVDQITDGSGEILKQQGILALALIPFFDREVALGYVGFDDCVRTRRWTTREVLFLKSIAALLGTLVKRRNAERSSRNSFEALKLIMDSSDDLIYANSLEDYRLVYVNQKLADQLGRRPEELLGKKCYDVFRLHSENPCTYCPIPKLKMNTDNNRSDTYSWENTFEVMGKTYLSKDTIIRWIDGSFVHVQTSTDISARIRHEKQLQYYASTDTMTGVSNREWGGKQLEQRLRQNSGIPASLCFLDVDGLKHTNDHFGHTMGDALLQDTVRMIKAWMGEDDILCRWGGDEFLLLLEKTPDLARQTISEIQKDMDRENAKKEKPYKLSFSYGIVPFEGDDFDELVKRADGLMYDDKMAKRGKLMRRRRTDPCAPG